MTSRTDPRRALTPEFFHVFGTWFNVDTVDLDDPDAVRSSAGACASVLARQTADVDGLKAGLQAGLANLDDALFGQFEYATDTDWRFDAETEHTLRTIIGQLIEELEFQQGRTTNR